MSNLSRHELEAKVKKQLSETKRKLRILKLADKIFVELQCTLTYGTCIEHAVEAETVKSLYLKGE